ncbi:expressed unknown protein [Seminavis robusta]|uniref:Uncharacterized protein n=1 Tax=Seminavis robusta TaxID=568900 RepID=A0A9N8HS21_9STRA|nr:expressed unknown protein [Seminavis robusta]|eukprot:Sro1385_g268190.1 n/a (1166) ;mRNA; r:6799-10296
MVVDRRPSYNRRPSILTDYDLSDSLKSILDDVPATSEMLTSSSHHTMTAAAARSSQRGSRLFSADQMSALQALYDDDSLASSTHSRSLFGGSTHSQALTSSSWHNRGSGNGVQTAYGRRGLGLTKRQSVRDMTSALEAKRIALPAPKRKENPNYLPNIVGDLKASIAGRDVFEDYDHRKKANSICRWNLLWLLLLLLAPYPLWLSFVNCRMAYEMTIVLNAIMTLNFIYTTILCWRYMWRMVRAFNTPFWEELDEEVREKVQHIVVMPTYKEPVELILETISSIANQTVADSIILVVGMEQKTPEQELKKQQINEQFGLSFKALVYSVHPSGVPGEIPGACSNRNYAARTAVKHMIREGMLPVDPQTKEVDLDFTMVTVCDADTTFYYRYFENLTSLFLREDPQTRFQVCWQSPLFYNIALDERWFFTRVMGILRSYFMIGFLIGCDINTMSIYSQSLRLLIQSRYFHPGYQMDDIIYTLSAMKATGKRIRIRVIDIPTLSGPTSGDTIVSEFEEWVVQATRWTIGAAEVFHYFFVKLLRGNYFLPGFAYFWWFVYYYGFVLCVNGLVNMSNTVIFVLSYAQPDLAMEHCQPFGLGEDFQYAWIFPFFIIFTQIFVFGTAFFMDALVSQVLALAEEINPMRNFFHYLSSPFVLMVYCLVEYKAILTIAIYGKKVCGHIASDKGSLVKSSVLDPNKSSLTASVVGTGGPDGLPPAAAESWTNSNNNNHNDNPEPFASSKTKKPKKDNTLPFHMSILNEGEEESSSDDSSSSAVSFASSSDSSNDSWHDEEAPAELGKTSYSSYAAQSTTGGASVGNLLQSLDESCRRLENRFQQKLLERQEELNASQRSNSAMNASFRLPGLNNNGSFVIRGAREQSVHEDARDSSFAEEEVPMLSSSRADRTMSQRSGLQKEPSLNLQSIGLQKQPSVSAKRGPGIMQKEPSLNLQSLGLQQQEQPPPLTGPASMQKQAAVNRQSMLQKQPSMVARGPAGMRRQASLQQQSMNRQPSTSFSSQPSTSLSRHSSGMSRNSQNSFASGSVNTSQTQNGDRKPPPLLLASPGDFGSKKDANNINAAVAITNDPVVEASRSSPYESAWMNEGSTPESITRRPLIMQMLDWSKMQQDKEGAHGYAAPYMRGVMSSLDEEAYIPPQRSSDENGYRSYLIRR